MKSYEEAVRYLAREEAQIRQVYNAKQDNYLAGAYGISEALGNQFHCMMGAHKEHAFMVSYIYDKPTNTVYRDMQAQEDQN